MKKIFKDRLFLIIFIIMVITIIILLLYLVSIKIKKEPIKKINEITLLSEVNNYSIFFSNNSIINNFYDYENEELLDILDPNYIVNNNININNVNKLKSSDYSEYTFYASKMYQKKINNTTYYFVSGELHQGNNNNTVITNEKFLITINNKNYYLMPISTDNIKEFANSFKVEDIQINNNGNNSYLFIEYNDKMIIDFYLKYYYNLMYVDTNKAFSLSQNIPTLEQFSDNLNTYNEIFNSEIINYQSQGKDGSRTYYITKENGQIIITENAIMDIKVEVNIT